MKTCLICGKTLPLTEFYKTASGSQGVHAYCIECTKAAVKTWQSANREKLNAYQRRYRKEHPEQARQKVREWATQTRESRRDNAMLNYFEYLKTEVPE